MELKEQGLCFKCNSYSKSSNRPSTPQQLCHLLLFQHSPSSVNLFQQNFCDLTNLFSFRLFFYFGSSRVLWWKRFYWRWGRCCRCSLRNSNSPKSRHSKLYFVSYQWPRIDFGGHFGFCKGTCRTIWCLIGICHYALTFLSTIIIFFEVSL